MLSETILAYSIVIPLGLSGGYMKSSARVIADSITNLSVKRLIDTNVTAA